MELSKFNRKGYTLIELCVVIVILALISSAIVPNLVRARDAQTRREFEAEVFRLASWARESAIQGHRTLALTTGDRSIQVIQETESSEENTLRSITMPDGIDTGAMAAEGEESTSGEWRLHFYPDGSSDGGGIELSDNGRIRSLQIGPDGSMKMVEGNLEDNGTQKWSAGEYEKRA
jgi:prepilin-type N-terminal cleavage/methylation domain-containing protein